MAQARRSAKVHKGQFTTMQPRHLPAIDKLLKAPALAPLVAQQGAGMVKEALRALQGQLRRSGQVPAWAGQAEEYALRLGRQLAGCGYRPVHNMTGTIIHTNLGRAPLSPTLWKAAQPLISGSMNLEYDLTGGGTRRPGQPRGATVGPLDRRRRRPDCQQQRRRPAAGAEHLGRRPDGAGVPRRTDRNRRQLPPARPDAALGLSAA